VSLKQRVTQGHWHQYTVAAAVVEMQHNRSQPFIINRLHDSQFIHQKKFVNRHCHSCSCISYFAPAALLTGVNKSPAGSKAPRADRRRNAYTGQVVIFPFMRSCPFNPFPVLIMHLKPQTSRQHRSKRTADVKPYARPQHCISCHHKESMTQRNTA
jgi:hypothetical protein